MLGRGLGKGRKVDSVGLPGTSSIIIMSVFGAALRDDEIWLTGRVLTMGQLVRKELDSPLRSCPSPLIFLPTYPTRTSVLQLLVHITSVLKVFPAVYP